YNTAKTSEHKNSEVGIAQTILNNLTQDHQVFVCEMGAYGKGGIALLSKMAKPQIAILTGANEQHLATFGSVKNLLSAEGGEELVRSLPDGGVVIANLDSELLRKQLPIYQEKYKNRKFIFCSAKEKAEVWANNINAEKDRVLFTVHVGQEEARFEAKILGKHNIENILLAVAAAKECGMSLQELAESAKRITDEINPMKLKKGVGGLNIIDSTYSANPDGVLAALEYLKTWPGKKVIVMPCLIELGKASSAAHFRIGEKIAEMCDLAVIVTADKFKELKNGAQSRGMQEGQIIYIENPEIVLAKVKEIIKEKDDIVLLEGRIPDTMKQKFISPSL
ncbi:MAG: UDP-N-acetylmuramoyl-tripeptide--D-alanyl-D-alanine ligase, partial [Candidatus Wildermuthbacteria bacterium]|nr:UDP-N-acetylmuramoyl-tripeptide--D-alanyl-D-alanine ligase [Candidatus Wildermuthbacteria bacterium]